MAHRLPAVEINPYAPSAIPEPLVRPTDLGIGVWRDGTEIVLHPLAELPRFCLVTGRPARYGYPVKIAWSYPVDYRWRTLRLYVPLAAEVHHLCQRQRWTAIGSFVAAAVVAGLVMYRHDLTGPAGIAVALLALALVGVAAFYFYVQYSQFLYFGSKEGVYFRLRGADPRFLDKLLEWQT
jgi:hypothetical protein